MFTKGALTTLDIENTFNMDRKQMRHAKGGQTGRLAIWLRTTHAALLREADKEMLEVLPEDITASPRSVPLGMFDSRKCKFSFREKFLDSSMEDSVALPVFTPMNFWRCAHETEALVQRNQNSSCLDSLWHCLIVCEGSVKRAHDSDTLWYVLEVAPHGVLALGGTVQEFDLLRHFEIDGTQWKNLNTGDWQDWSAIAVSGVHRAFVRREYLLKPEHLRLSLHGVIYDLGCAPFQKLMEFSAERGFPNCGAWHLGKLVTELDIPHAGCKPRSLSGLLALLMTWALPHWIEQQMEEAIYNRGVKVPSANQWSPRRLLLRQTTSWTPMRQRLRWKRR